MSSDLTDFDGFPDDLRPLVRTEADWLVATDPELMLRYLENKRADRSPSGRRKLRLFATGSCRRVWHFIEQYSALRTTVEFAEQFADTGHPKKRLKKVQAACNEWSQWARRQQGLTLTNLQVAEAVSRACHENANLSAWAFTSLGVDSGGDRTKDHPVLCQLFHCIFGNPFRPVAFDPNWRSETAVALATGVYESRAFDRLPILADALEEAGCDHPDVLAHCRQPDAPHARGCWVVDGVLGKG